jgi:hypothetical protein
LIDHDFRPAALHVRSSPGEADGLSARIRPQAQCKQIGKTEGGHELAAVDYEKAVKQTLGNGDAGSIRYKSRP